LGEEGRCQMFRVKRTIEEDENLLDIVIMNKKYYKLSHSSDPKIIGVSNGVCQGNIKWKYFHAPKSEELISQYFSLSKFLKHEKKIEPINFEIEYVEAYKTAKLTDLFLFSPALYGVSYFVSSKVKEIFESFKLPISTFIPAVIYHNGNKYHYWAFYIVEQTKYDTVDFQHSKFYKGLTQSIFPKRYIYFKSFEEYHSYKEDLVAREVIKINKHFNQNLDLHSCIWHPGGYLISEELKLELEKSNLKGLVISEIIHPKLEF